MNEEARRQIQEIIARESPWLIPLLHLVAQIEGNRPFTGRYLNALVVHETEHLQHIVDHHKPKEGV